MPPKINPELFTKQRTPPSLIDPPPETAAPQQVPEGIVQLAPSRLVPFQSHPFKPYTDEKLSELAASIERNGIISPVIVRPKAEDYEIISGHNRVAAARLIPLPTVPCIVHDVDDDTAMLELLESNLETRELLLPSEKAWAYKARYEAMKRQGKRLEVTSGQVDQKLTSSSIMAQTSPDSEKQIRRYISLTKLIQSLLDMVDSGEMPFMAGVNISALSSENQQLVNEFLTGRHIKLDIQTSAKIKHLHDSDNITLKTLEEVFTPKPPPKPKVVKIRYSRIQSYIPPETGAKETEEIIIEALKQYYREEH